MSKKIGQGHLSAMGRLGLRELRAAVNPSKESVASEEIGLYGTALPSEVAVQREATEAETRLANLHSLMTEPPSQQPRENSQELSR